MNHVAVSNRARAAGVVARHAAERRLCAGGHVHREPQTVRLEECVEVVEHYAQDWGYALDRKRSTSATPVFTKPLLGPWLACISLDVKCLNRPFAEAGSGWGPELEMGFGAIHEAARISQAADGKALVYLMCFLFPIYIAPFGDVYRKFNSLAELEVNVTANLQMYQIVMHDFEHAFAAGLAQAMEQTA